MKVWKRPKQTNYENNWKSTYKAFEVKGEFANVTGNQCKVIEEEKAKQGRSKFSHKIACEITYGTTSKLAADLDKREAWKNKTSNNKLLGVI